MIEMGMRRDQRIAIQKFFCEEVNEGFKPAVSWISENFWSSSLTLRYLSQPSIMIRPSKIIITKTNETI